jgi:hypothetical protein
LFLRYNPRRRAVDGRQLQQWLFAGLGVVGYTVNRYRVKIKERVTMKWKEVLERKKGNLQV